MSATLRVEIRQVLDDLPRTLADLDDLDALDVPGRGSVQDGQMFRIDRVSRTISWSPGKGNRPYIDLSVSGRLIKLDGTIGKQRRDLWWIRADRLPSVLLTRLDDEAAALADSYGLTIGETA
jgi:hypothetical protein